MPRGGITQQRLQKGMQRLTIGTVQAMDKYFSEKEIEALKEMDEQFKIEVNGRAEEFPVWDQVDIKFGTTFVDATGQRDSPFDRPHFTYGAEITSDSPVGILACVMNWKVNDKGETTAARVAIGAVATDLSTMFSGLVHMTFQGYGAPVDVYGDQGLTP